MENMEGGLDYLKAVILEDKLGLCEQLDEQMQYVIDTYQCEWKGVINDESKRKRFRHFVNSEQRDDNVVFVEERGQFRPADDKERKHFTLTEIA
jgi:nitrite reductase (NADH) large subunit